MAKQKEIRAILPETGDWEVPYLAVINNLDSQAKNAQAEANSSLTRGALSAGGAVGTLVMMVESAFQYGGFEALYQNAVGIGTLTILVLGAFAYHSFDRFASWDRVKRYNEGKKAGWIEYLYEQRASRRPVTAPSFAPTSMQR